MSIHANILGLPSRNGRRRGGDHRRANSRGDTLQVCWKVDCAQSGTNCLGMLTRQRPRRFRAPTRITGVISALLGFRAKKASRAAAVSAGRADIAEGGGRANGDAGPNGISSGMGAPAAVRGSRRRCFDLDRFGGWMGGDLVVAGIENEHGGGFVVTTEGARGWRSRKYPPKNAPSPSRTALPLGRRTDFTVGNEEHRIAGSPRRITVMRGGKRVLSLPTISDRVTA
jgi:hypothetical protein